MKKSVYSDEELKRMIGKWSEGHVNDPKRTHNFVVSLERKIRTEYKKKLILISAIWCAILGVLALIMPLYLDFFGPLSQWTGISSLGLCSMLFATVMAFSKVSDIAQGIKDIASKAWRGESSSRSQHPHL